MFKLKVKVFTAPVSFVITLTAFPTVSKPISANDSFPRVLVREDTPSTPPEEVFTGQFSTNASDLLANPHNERLNIEFSRYVNIEIGERSCDVVSYLASSFDSFRSSSSAFDSVFLPNTPASTITISVTTPTRGRQTVKLESEESIDPEFQKLCYGRINIAREVDSELHIQIHKPVQQSELELTIQNAWDMLN
ncbi:hypothetical protein [Coleofasciculus sp.]|uniref:hypothetical protein n=1 Tax=Coleofasciculus sp. TaxID=3100458 RepID=UPI0039F95FEA